MKNKYAIQTCFLAVVCMLYILGPATVSAKPLDQSALQVIQSRWLVALDTQGSQPQRFSALQRVTKEMFKLSLKHPRDAELKAWTGVMLSSFAGAKKEGRGEHLAFAAQRMLENAQVLQFDILDRSHLINGMSAREALKRALVYNPSKLDVNVYYSDFLTEQSINMLAANTKESLEDTTIYSRSVIQAVN